MKPTLRLTDPLPPDEPPPNLPPAVPLARVLALVTELLSRDGVADPPALARALVTDAFAAQAPSVAVPPHAHPGPALSPLSLVPGVDALPADPELRVVLTGGFDRDDFHGLVLQKGDRVVLFRLTRPEFVFLVVLASLALTNAGLPAPFSVEGAHFLPPRRIIKTLDDRQRVDHKLDGAFDNATEANVHRWVYQIRKRLSEAAFPPSLIETAGSRKGFRVAVLPRNLFIYLR